MLDATRYIERLNIYAVQAKQAEDRHDSTSQDQAIEKFKRVLAYCGDHGLVISDTTSGAPLTLRRVLWCSAINRWDVWYCPNNILIEGKDGYRSRQLPNHRAMRHINEQRDYEPWYEQSHYWEERRAIERDYIELSPW